MYLYRLVRALGTVPSTSRTSGSYMCRSSHRCFSESRHVSQSPENEYRKQARHTTLLGVSAVVTTGVASYIFYDSLRIPEPVKATFDAIRNNKDAQELLGPKIFFRSDWSVHQNGDESHVEVKAYGNKSGGMFQCTLLKSPSQWKVVKLDVIYTAAKEKSAELNIANIYDELDKFKKS